MGVNHFVHHPVNDEETTSKKETERNRGKGTETMAKQHRRKKGEESQKKACWNGCEGITERQEGGKKAGRKVKRR